MLNFDFIIFATSTPDHYVPGSSCILQDKMNLNGIGALDIRVQCSGFVYGLSIAEQYIKSGQFNNILVTGGGAFNPNLIKLTIKKASFVFVDVRNSIK